MTTRHSFSTDDPSLADKLRAVIQAHEAGTLAAIPAGAGAAPPPPPAPTAVATPPPPPAPAAAAASPPPPPPPAPTAAAPPPPPPAPVAAAPAPDAALQVAPPGWTVDHIKQAAAAFTANPAKGGADGLQNALRPFCPPGEARPSIKKVYPAYWPQLHAALTAA